MCRTTAGQPKCSTTTSDVTTTTNSNDHGHGLRMSRIRAATCWIGMFWMGACTYDTTYQLRNRYLLRSPPRRVWSSLPDAGLSLVTGNQPSRRARSRCNFGKLYQTQERELAGSCVVCLLVLFPFHLSSHEESAVKAAGWGNLGAIASRHQCSECLPLPCLRPPSQG